MGHKIQKQVGSGECGLTQCSCGQGALKIGNRLLQLSAEEVGDMAAVFAALGPDFSSPSPIPVVEELNRLMGEAKWADFKPGN